jgi:hypothetical protein
MFVAEIDRTHCLLKITVADHVATEDARLCLKRLQSLLVDIQPGFRLVSDLSGIKSMSADTAPYIGQIMDLCAAKGLQSVVRVLPSDKRNDIGYAILSQFHYGPEVRIVTFNNAEEAASHVSE